MKHISKLIPPVLQMMWFPASNSSRIHGQSCLKLGITLSRNQAWVPSGKVINRVFELYSNGVPQFEHLSVLVVPPLEMDSMVPKKETFSVPQFGQRPFRIRESLTTNFVRDWANQTIKGTAANQVKMKLNGFGSSKTYVISNPVRSSKKKNSPRATTVAGTFKRTIFK